MSWQDILKDFESNKEFKDYNIEELKKFLMYRLNRAIKSLEFYENEKYKDEGEIIEEDESKVFEEYINMLKGEIKHLKNFIPRYMKLANEIEDLNEYYEDLDKFREEHFSLIG